MIRGGLVGSIRCERWEIREHRPAIGMMDQVYEMEKRLLSLAR